MLEALAIHLIRTDLDVVRPCAQGHCCVGVVAAEAPPHGSQQLATGTRHSSVAAEAFGWVDLHDMSHEIFRNAFINRFFFPLLQLFLKFLHTSHFHSPREQV